MKRALAVDTSALFAVLNREPESTLVLTLLGHAETRLISAATLHEAHCVDIRGGRAPGDRTLSRLVAGLKLSIVPFDEEMLEVSRLGYSRFGRGTGHPARLNMGDCFAYALAKARDLPLLFKGEDFLHTDIRSAMSRQ